MTPDQAVPILHMFNEKADKLERSRFIQTLMQGKSGFRFGWDEAARLTGERYGPDQEAIDAAILTYRFFVVSNEATSLRNMATLYAGLPIDPELVRQFGELRDRINAYLDGSPRMGSITSTGLITVDGQPLTTRDILDTFINGDLGHANNPKARAQFESWRVMPPFFAMLEHRFVHAMATVILGLPHLRAINVAVLAELRQQGVPGA